MHTFNALVQDKTDKTEGYENKKDEIFLDSKKNLIKFLRNEKEYTV